MKGFRIKFESPGKAVLEKIEVPVPTANEVLLENDYTVISAGTERANLLCMPNTGSVTNGFPFYPGYSGSGRVVACGDEVTNLRVGDRVVINWGGHQSHTISKAPSILKIEDDRVDLLDAAFAPIAAFSFLGVRKLKLELGEPAMIVGQGILGAFALQIAVLSGAIPVLASDPDPTRRTLALKLGAAQVFSPDEDNYVEKVKTASGGQGPKAVVEVTGSSAALNQVLACIAREGRISLLGCTRISDIPVDFYKFVHLRGVSLIGAHTSARPNHESSAGQWTEHDDYRTFLQFLSAKKIQVKPLISEVVSPLEGPAVYTRLARDLNPPLGIVFDWKSIR